MSKFLVFWFWGVRKQGIRSITQRYVDLLQNSIVYYNKQNQQGYSSFISRHFARAIFSEERNTVPYHQLHGETARRRITTIISSSGQDYNKKQQEAGLIVFGKQTSNGIIKILLRS